MAVVFDAPGKSFRADLYADYKANRPPMPDELRAQVGPLLEAIEAMGIPLLRIEGVEADDVIGTLARQATASGTATVISTGDKDFAQLVDGHVTLVNTMDNTKLDRAGVEQKFGVSPEQIIDYLALVGDTSDNIPGVPGVGPKTAAKWLQQYGDLDTLKASAGEVTGKIGERLRESLGQLDLSKQLATIRCDVDLPLEAGRSRAAAARCGTARRVVRAAGIHAAAAARSGHRRRARRRPRPRRSTRTRGTGSRTTRRPLRDGRDVGRPRALVRAYRGGAARRASTPRRRAWPTCAPSWWASRSRSRPVKRPTFRSRIVIPARPIN